MSAEIERERARFAFNTVGNWMRSGDVKRAATVWLPGLPVLIRSQGLLVAIAMLRKDGADALAKAFGDWLLRESRLKRFGEHTRGDLLELCLDADRTIYRSLQTEAIALAEMLKLMADAQGLKGAR